MTTPLMSALKLVSEALERLGIPCLTGGSIASSSRGIVRATMDVDLLAKLQWYRDGGEISDRQWADITGIVEANSTPDTAYLEAWARRLGVSELLAKALAAHPL